MHERIGRLIGLRALCFGASVIRLYSKLRCKRSPIHNEDKRHAQIWQALGVLSASLTARP